MTKDGVVKHLLLGRDCDTCNIQIDCVKRMFRELQACFHWVAKYDINIQSYPITTKPRRLKVSLTKLAEEQLSVKKEIPDITDKTNEEISDIAKQELLYEPKLDAEQSLTNALNDVIKKRLTKSLIKK